MSYNFCIKARISPKEIELQKGCLSAQKIESPKKGGAIITARLANDYNREVLHSGNNYQKQSSGTNWLIEKHMQLF